MTSFISCKVHDDPKDYTIILTAKLKYHALIVELVVVYVNINYI